MRVDWDKILSPPQRETDASVNQTGNLTKAEIEKSKLGSKSTDSSSSLSIDTKNSTIPSPKNCNERLGNCIDQCRKENPYSSTWTYSFTASFVQSRRNRCYDSCQDTVMTFGCDSKIDNLPYNENSP